MGDVIDVDVGEDGSGTVEAADDMEDSRTKYRTRRTVENRD